jgi:hypothetical protein
MVDDDSDDRPSTPKRPAAGTSTPPVAGTAKPPVAGTAKPPAAGTSKPPASLHPGAVLASLGDETRLRVFSAVALGATSEESVAQATGLDRRQVRRALDRLGGAGLVVGRGLGPGEGELSVAVEQLRQSARLAGRMRQADDAKELGATPEQAAVLRGFLVDGRLVSIPAARGKRMVLLDFLAQRFEPGRVYPERKVNLLLGRVHDDFAALRRYLVDEEFLERRGGFYWRSGGSFEVE